MKVILLFLSTLITVSCSSPASESETNHISNDVLIDSIIVLSKSWSDSIDVEVEDLGRKIQEPYTFYPIGNSYYPQSILIKCKDGKDAQNIVKSELLKNMDCASESGFTVCHETNEKGYKLRYSLRPHPILNWIFRIERVN